MLLSLFSNRNGAMTCWGSNSEIITVCGNFKLCTVKTTIINRQPTCLVVSDSCCSILSTTFLKGGRFKGSASQQDLIIWYLHNIGQKQKQKNTFRRQTLNEATFNVTVSCVRQHKCDRMLWLGHHLSSNTIPHVILLLTLLFHLNNY